MLPAEILTLVQGVDDGEARCHPARRAVCSWPPRLAPPTRTVGEHLSTMRRRPPRRADMNSFRVHRFARSYHGGLRSRRQHRRDGHRPDHVHRCAWHLLLSDVSAGTRLKTTVGPSSRTARRHPVPPRSSWHPACSARGPSPPLTSANASYAAMYHGTQDGGSLGFARAPASVEVAVPASARRAALARCAPRRPPPSPDHRSREQPGRSA